MKLVERAKSRGQKDIKDWQKARQRAQHPERPKRDKVYLLYDDVVIDNHISSLMTTRKLKTKGEPFKIYDPNVGDKDIDKTALLQRPWFYDFLDYALDSLFYGHSLMEFPAPKNGEFDTVYLVPREHVIPERGEFLPDLSMTEGVSYYQPAYQKWVLEVGKPDDLGLLLKAAINFLYKKNVQAAWSEFTEIFGMPLRYAKTPSRDDREWGKIQKMMEQMGSAAYGVFPEGTEVNFVEASGKTSSADVYNKLIERCNTELSKLFIGQTMLTENGSSRSQSEVHERLAEEYIKADKRFISYVINHKVLPFLRMHGYPFSENDVFGWDDSRELSLEEQWKIDQGLLQHFDIDEEYFKEKYGVPIIGKKTSNNPGDPPPGNDGPEDKKKSDRLTPPRLNSCYPPKLPVNMAPLNVDEDEARKVNDQVINDIRQGNQEFNQQYFEYVASSLIGGLQEGWSLDGISYDQPDHVKRGLMELNIFRFAGAKSSAAVQELNGLMTSSKSFNEFKEKAVPLMDDYSINHLRTEYNTARAAGQNASSYYRMVDNKDVMPYWEYRTVGDNRVRDSHRALHKQMFEADDPAFDLIYPPNGWNCRCEVLPRPDHGGQEVWDKDKAREALGATGELDKMRKYDFDINRGKAGQVFTKNQEYLQEFNVNSLGLKQSGRPSFDEINSGELPELQLAEQSQESIDAWWEANKFTDTDGRDKVRLLDYGSKPLILQKKPFQKKRRNKERRQLLPKVDGILKNPDEVWFQRDKDSVMKYIKFFRDKPITIVVMPQQGEFKIKTWYPMDKKNEIDTQIRGGILIKKP